MKPVIAFDADGVLLDYNRAYPVVYERAFGKPLPVVRSDAYHASAMFDLVLESGSPERERFYTEFDKGDAWATMPLFDGVWEACWTLHNAGYELVCVTSMPERFAAARLQNFRLHDLPFDRVIATGRIPHVDFDPACRSSENPKLPFIRELKPVAFVDDQARNFDGVDSGVHRALIDYGQADSPNRTRDLSDVDTHHGSAEEFAHWWMEHRHREVFAAS